MMRSISPAIGTNTIEAGHGAYPTPDRIRQKQNVRSPPSKSKPTTVRLMKTLPHDRQHPGNQCTACEPCCRR